MPSNKKLFKAGLQLAVFMVLVLGYGLGIITNRTQGVILILGVLLVGGVLYLSIKGFDSLGNLRRGSRRNGSFLRAHKWPGPQIDEKPGADGKMHMVYALPPSLYFEGRESLTTATLRFSPADYAITYDFPKGASLRLVAADTGEIITLGSNTAGTMTKNLSCKVETDYRLEIAPVWADGSVWQVEVVQNKQG